MSRHTELLEWGINNSKGNPTESVQPEKLDPKWIDIILGKKDSVRMKELAEIMTNASAPVDQRLGAFDEFEMLVESLDNANDLRPLGLWKVLIDLTNDSDPVIRENAYTIVGTSVQNNEKSQLDFLQMDGLNIFTSKLDTEMNCTVLLRLVKCVFCKFYLTLALIKHNSEAFKQFYNQSGFIKMHKVLERMAQDKQEQNLWKTLFLLSSSIRDSTENISISAALAIVKAEIPNLASRFLDEFKENAEICEKSLELLDLIKAKNV